MKSIIKGEKVKKEYYLGCYQGSSCFGYEPVYYKIDVNYPSEKNGEISSSEEFLEYITVKETENINRILREKDTILVDEQHLKIYKVVHDTEGNVIYFTDYKEVVEDLDSKTEAEKNFELRKLFLEERKKEKSQVNQETQLNNNNLPKNSRKRWWEFSE
ncbi:hypothetical protein EEL30_21500 [Brevibacillus laterosporus]|uniref:Uncharacterized protein n=1 Tax=Brevibacillus laterosporus TaxID=1465 RepID=A0A518VCA0_BRELA|nr:hypothetical protein EEL30_21500 [Brevibacillus laterosporus]